MNNDFGLKPNDHVKNWFCEVQLRQGYNVFYSDYVGFPQK
jgi:hypothetical protein